MAVVKTTLSLTDLDRKWMDTIIASGEYVSSSEYVRTLIRKDKEQRAARDAIRAKLTKAEESGFTDMTREEILAQSKEALRRNGEL